MALTNLAPQDQQILEKINALRDYSSDEIGTTAFDKFHIANIKPFLEATTTPKLTRIFQLAVDDPKNYIKKCLDEWRQHKAQQAAQAKMKDKSLLLRVNKNVPVTGMYITCKGYRSILRPNSARLASGLESGESSNAKYEL